MKAQDLRIGNFISVNRFGLDIPARIEDFNDLQQISNGFVKAEGEPITEEWLIRKLGFDKSYTSNVRTRFDLIDDVRIGYDFNNYGETDGLEGFRYVGNYFPHIKYVHQLQNLYHALTGEELTFKD